MSTEKVNFNLNKGKFGAVDLNNLKGGMKREQIKDKNLLAIFDALDDGNHVLDEKEINNLKTMLQQYAKDNNLSKREAGKYLEALFGEKGKSTVTKEDLFKFINSVNNSSKNVKSSKVIEENGQKVIQTEYKDGSVEKLYPKDGKKVLIRNNKTETFDKDNNLLKEEYFDKDGNSVATTFEDGNPKRTIKRLKDNAGVETVDYKDGKPKSRTLKNDSETLYYEIGDNGAEQLKKRTGSGENAPETTYEYNEDGTVKETLKQGDRTVTSVKKGETVLSSASVETTEDSTIETTVDENGNVTKNVLNKDGKKVRQEKTIDGKTYVAEYDGNGNTKVIVQNGESISKLAKIFGVKADDIIEINGEKVKGRSTKFFRVGEEVLIPREVEADDDALKNRKSSEDTIEDFNRDEAIREERRRARQREEEEARKNDVSKSKYVISFTCQQKTFEEVARVNLKSRGITNPTKKQLADTIADFKKLNPKLKDGQLRGKRINCRVSEETYRRVAGKQKEVAEINKNIRINNSAKGIAERLYKVCDDNAAGVNKKEFWNELNKINKENVIAVLDNYDKVIQKHTEDSSLFDTICSEVGASEANRKKACTQIFNKLEEAARAAGVSEAEIKQARKKFISNLNKEFDEIGTVNTKEMEKAVDFLRGAAAAAKLSASTGEVSTKEAMKSFLNGEDGLVAMDKDVQKQYSDAREKEGWVAKTGDWVCGLFGCTTIDDMDKKLGKHAADVKKLVAAANNNDEAQFKKLYKQIFGIDFNPKMIKARQTARENYEAAAAFDASYKAFAGLEAKTKNMNYQTLRNEIKNKFKYSDADINALIDSYAESKGIANNSPEDKKYILDAFIKESKQTYLKEFQKLSKGKNLEQMGKDVELLTKSAYGTNDIVKDVIKFNENQQMTEMITSAAFEIAGTIALQFVPGLGQVAAARLAVSAAKWGVKGVKVASYAAKASKAMATASKVMSGSTKAKIATQMATAGVATATVNLTDKKSVEDTLRKTLMNMSFAGVGASSSILAPKLMQSFGIANKALANEIAEEIINVAGSYGVTKISGSDYGKTDGFIDFASGLIMSRISHVKMHKPHADVDVTPAPGPKPVGPVDPDLGTKKLDPDLDPNDMKSPKIDPNEPQGAIFDNGVVDIVDDPTFKPTADNPKKVSIFGTDFEVIKLEKMPDGRKILGLEDGSQLTLDKQNRIIKFQDDDNSQIVLKYKGKDSQLSQTLNYDSDSKIVKVADFDGKKWVEKDYNSAKISTYESLENTSGKTIGYLKLSEYPAEAVIPSKFYFEDVLKTQIDQCTDINKLKELKSEYDLYNSKYEKLDTSIETKLKHKELELAGPSPENPLVTNILGNDVNVIKIDETTNTKTLHIDDGSKVTIDKASGNPMKIVKDDKITTMVYANPSDKTPWKTKTTNKKHQLLNETEIKGDTKIVKDYTNAKETVYGTNQNNYIASRYLSLSEFPPNAVVPEPAYFSKILSDQIDECTDLNKLQDLMNEYSTYNSQFGALDGTLFKKFQDKSAELKALATTVPHKPLSGLITSTGFDDALKNFDVQKYGKKGLPLKYSHDSMVTDLNNYLNSLPPSEKLELMKDFNIEFVPNNGKLELKDIPNLSASSTSANAHKVADILEKYSKNNELQIADPALKSELEKFIKDVPEFSFIIGKAQNGNHAYSLDSHTIQNLQKALKYADDVNLGDSQKEVLKMSILLHDLGKNFKGVSTSDTGHAILSKQYAEKILERFNYSSETKEKILNLVENHHWFKEFNKGNMSADDVMKMFGDDLPLAKIMAKADLESVSDDFHLTILEPGKKLTPAEFEAKFNEEMNKLDPASSTNPHIMVGDPLPIGTLKDHHDYVFDAAKVDKFILGNGVELDVNEPKFKQLLADLKEGDSFAVGCIDPKTTYNDVKYQIGKYADGVGSHHLVISKNNGQIVINAHKTPTSVYKDIPTKVNSDPKIAQAVEKYRKKATSIVTKTFTVKDKQTPFEVLLGSKDGGSNTGYYVINKETGELFYAKEAGGGNQWRAEMAATKLYEAAGVDVPDVSTFTAPDGTKGTISKFVPDLQPLKTPNPLANDGFGMDVLLANWDSIGLSYDNTLITADGKRVVKIDAGGSFDYHAHASGNKPFTSIPMELITMLDPHINQQASNIFGSMTRADMIKSLEKAVNLKQSDIKSILTSANCDIYIDRLIQRKKFIQIVVDEMKKNSQASGESMSAYMRRMTNSALDKSIASAKTHAELQDLKQAVAVINDASIKSKLLNAIAKQEAAIPAPKIINLSETQIGNLLVKSGFAKGYGGKFEFNMDSATESSLISQFGASQASKIKAKMQIPLSVTDIINIQTMINEAAKVMDLSTLDMQKVVVLYRNIKEGNSQIFGYNLKDMTPAKWAAVMNITQKKYITADQLAAFDAYKCSSSDIATELTKLSNKEITNLSPYVKAQVEAMQSYINTQVLSEDIHLVRQEGYYHSGNSNQYGCLKSITLPNGKTLDKALSEAVASGQAAIDAIEDQINLAPIRYKAHNERFTSAFFYNKAGGASGKVVWDLTVKKGSKGVFLEGNNFDGSLSGECEFLLQKDSKFEIVNIEWKNGYWKVKANVTN